MASQETSLFSENCKQEFAELLLEFLQNNLPPEVIPNIEVEIRYKGEGREEVQAFFRQFSVGCARGQSNEGDPCYSIPPEGTFVWTSF